MMNRSKRPVAKSQVKAVRKAIRLAQVPQPAPQPLKTDQLLKKSPLRKQLAVKKLKKTAKVSKRTNVGTTLESPPKNPHMEGGRWMKTVIRQNILKGKGLTKRLSKK